MSGYHGPPVDYPSKRDLWLEAVIWLSCLAILAAVPAVWQAGGTLALLLAGIAGFTLWLFYGTSYRLDDRELVARAGPFRWRVPLAAIEGVVPTRNPLSAPACSLDRLAVRHSGRRLGLLISPADREDFLRELRLRCPHLEERGDRLVAA